MWGLWTYHVLKAELSTAFEIAREFLTLAERAPYPGVAMRGQWAMQVTRTHQGEFGLALEHFEKALPLCDAGRDRENSVLDALNPGVTIRCFAAWSLWFIGRPDRAYALMQEAVTLSKDLAEPHGLAHALVFAAVLHQLRGERPMALKHADAAVALSAE